jgi:hypothetical protein
MPLAAPDLQLSAAPGHHVRAAINNGGDEGVDEVFVHCFCSLQVRLEACKTIA